MNGLFGVHQNYVIQVEKYRRNQLKDYLNENGIETLISWERPNHKQSALFNPFRKDTNLNLPKTEYASQTVLSLPMYPELSELEIAYVCETVRSFFNSSC
jgi:dTDP-4-amino-4,6-dideoxygalactose transaminase